MATAKQTVKSPQEKTVDRSAKKSENFKRLATKRVNRALKVISGVGQLANRNSYTYDDAQVSKIKTALETAVAGALSRFSAKADAASESFTV